MTDPADDHLASEVEVDLAFEEAPRLSPAARRFMAGDMPDDEAVRLGFRRPPPDDDDG
jgi:hypothetical protein